jgi:hypothetical protein
LVYGREATRSLVGKKEGRETMLYALCGLSGSGKTTVLEATLQRAHHLARLVTFTTRSPRSGETSGRDYHFLTAVRFQILVGNGCLVCPIQYRGEWYATAQADLRACTQRDTLAVLRPDKLACLAAYTPIIGVYLEMVGQEAPRTEDDQVIVTHQFACRTHLSNVPGHLDQVVTTLLNLLNAPQAALVQGGLHGTQGTRANDH